MAISQDQIWDTFNHNKPIFIDATWLQTVYSLDLSIELRHIIAERLGILADIGWEAIKALLKEYGTQPELIHAAGLCHQKEAFNFLLMLFREQSSPDITIVRALECWGAMIPTADLKKILKCHSLELRLAGLNLLRFKSHLLKASELLELVEHLLDDFRDEVVIQVIKILQRRDEQRIINCIGKIASHGTDQVVETALIALGSIGTQHSALELYSLSRELVTTSHREIAEKQISHQYID